MSPRHGTPKIRDSIVSNMQADDGYRCISEGLRVRVRRARLAESRWVRSTVLSYRGRVRYDLLGRYCEIYAGTKLKRRQCDETRPICTNCIKTGRRCPGVPEEADLIFRTEQPGRIKPRKRARAPGRDQCEPEEAPGTELSISKSGKRLLAHLIFNPSIEVQAVTCFFNAYIVQTGQINVNSGFMELAAPMYSRYTEGSALHTAMEALSLASLSKRPGQQHLERKASGAYSHALDVARRSIDNAKQATSNATLLAILLLSLYEATTCTEQSTKAWANHIDGAAAIVIARGAKQIHDVESLLLFRAVRMQVITNAIQQHKSIPEFPGPKGWAVDLENPDTPAAAVLNHAMRLASLLSIAKQTLALHRTEQSIAQVTALLEDAYQLMETTAELELRTPFEYRWRTVATNMGTPVDWENVAELEAWPAPTLHVYKDLHSVALQNNDRISHILCASIVADAVKWLHPAQEAFECDCRYVFAKARIQLLVDQICASIPYHWYGNVLLEAGKAGPLPPRTAAEGLGGYVTIWPLYVASQAEEIPELQRQWLRGRIAAIGRHYGLEESRIICCLNRGRVGAGIDPEIQYDDLMGPQCLPHDSWSPDGTWSRCAGAC